MMLFQHEFFLKTQEWMTFQPLEDVAGPSISGSTLKVHDYPDILIMICILAT